MRTSAALPLRFYLASRVEAHSIGEKGIWGTSKSGVVYVPNGTKGIVLSVLKSQFWDYEVMFDNGIIAKTVDFKLCCPDDEPEDM